MLPATDTQSYVPVANCESVDHLRIGLVGPGREALTHSILRGREEIDGDLAPYFVGEFAYRLSQEFAARRAPQRLRMFSRAIVHAFVNELLPRRMQSHNNHSTRYTRLVDSFSGGLQPG